jgi:hypothetical protein
MMSMDQDNSPEPVTSRLVDAVRKVRIASADKSDVVVEMREAARTRLELLAQDLQPVIEDVPADDDRFDFALSSGLQPRFWIDATAHVMMGPDRRTYRFVRDTRLGRVLLAESGDRAEIAESIIGYIAERIHERDLVLAGEVVSYRELQTGRAMIDHDAADGKDVKAEEADNRIEQAIAALRNGEADSTDTETASSASAKAVLEPAAPGRAEPAPPAQMAPPRQRGVLQAIGGGLSWIMLGAAIGGGSLLYFYRDLLF